MLAALEARISGSQARLQAYRHAFLALPAAAKIADRCCIYVTGSYGRAESSETSDFDLFFVGDDAPGKHVTRTEQLVLFGELISLHAGDNPKAPRYPNFSRDGEFLRFHPRSDLLSKLGHPEDDYGNTFTARMLLLLESQVILNQVFFRSILEDVIGKYFEDYVWHADGFIPRFLLNDITRFWKTLCLNYEAFRKKTELAGQRLDNIKLRFCRKLTCFSTVICILRMLESNNVTATRLLDSVLEPPWVRIYSACQDDADLVRLADRMAEAYCAFLDVSEASKLTPNLLEDTDRWEQIKAQSESFSLALVELVTAVGPEDALQLVAL